MTATWRTGIVETHGACTNGDVPPQAWDLPDWGSSLTAENKLAIRICRERCPVLAACALETLTAKEYPHGVIRAGVQLRRTQHAYEPSEISIARLRATITGDAA